MKIRDRIKELRRVRAGDLSPNPRNWRTHPQGQVDALRGVIAEVGYADALLARELPDGTLELIDGHARQSLDPDQEVPVLVLDLDQDEALKLMTVLDPLAAMAEANESALETLLAEIDTDSEAVQAMLDEMAKDNGIDLGGEEEPVDAEPPAIRGGGIEDLAPTAEESAILSGRKILVEFSGGKDSSAAACWCREYLPAADTTLLFVDMGADFTGFMLFLHEFAEWIGIRLRVLRSKRNMVDLFLSKKEWPHFMHSYCHDQLHGALDECVREYNAEDIVVVRGGRREEKAASGRTNKTRWLELSKNPGVKYFQPLYFADKETGGEILRSSDAPTWGGYSRGLCRTACRVCPGQRPAAYAALRGQFPAEWEELTQIEAKLGHGAWAGRTEGNVPSFASLADHFESRQNGQ